MPSDAARPFHAEDAPSAWVVRFAQLIEGTSVLDLACGAGRHARFLARAGHQVLAIDRDPALLAGLDGEPRVATQCADLEAAAWPLGGRVFDGIVVTRYLHRPLFPHLLRALAPGGALIYETFALGNEAFGRPSSPDFLLMPGELLSLAGGGLTVVAFEQGRVDSDGRAAVVQRIAAVGRARPWPPALPSTTRSRRIG